MYSLEEGFTLEPTPEHKAGRDEPLRASASHEPTTPARPESSRSSTVRPGVCAVCGAQRGLTGGG
jgi:hypothetical protein